MPNTALNRPPDGKPRRILFTGGGSAGHVSVNLALIPLLQSRGWEALYMGSKSGIEKQLIDRLADVEYYGISTGKLRRYADLQNAKDPFRVAKGVIQAYRLIRRLKPDVVFSKGGFVSVPVVLGAWMNRVPVIIHESDLTPGLANRIANPFASKVCVTFGETAAHIKGNKAVHVGPIVRSELLRGSAVKGLQWSKLLPGKPVVLIMGGSLGSKRINEAVRRNLPALTKTYQLIHLCGKGELDDGCNGVRGYRQYEYVHDELPDLVACSELVISRAGSNSIFEFLALRKPMLLIPLSKSASRGDQILNAESFRNAGYCEVLQEEELTDEAFLAALGRLHADREAIRARMGRNDNGDPAGAIAALIDAASRN
ncbi:undecaprenyldiphospho-muramoylpentapeptide beta-N-acetylglucosaminyltransferase [Paenibacillus sacheonensis]|uniref:UDP-N-acetylglucosamine--N-acetylmuramyl-(pentapeptide) pyrophosphoryl-undecaprenol N-acetylglucosamine transferase n=1 Tax=Paenibacillus sacheonensis TaxID=742054 RepID=A0A7X4YP79_9BACL|nr:undecaprenyldiphospho-muramoylpentapeptide beta-N-acetylglucosaminyltransferase [Paenibacillus sacheonensis]MBM7565223.1 UDP-N-acetylglucosamine--N-acetylmuramyl-(pentapeptide) pyrophosphoryl-undecaprenol N-acetylglucosamine transferase [Paenibacillus sacheonensis]NBC70001.1 undecaprenyldiphospho-muramoylpentapeptide beta-N-acetylglucosaminyltransferase [Paenibacillus sacheonensis]